MKKSRNKYKPKTEIMSAQKQEAPEKTYSRAQFAVAVGFESTSSIYYSINKGMLKNKDVYTQKDVDEFLSKRDKKETIKKEPKGYTKTALSALLDRSHSYVQWLVSSGKLENKALYTEEEANRLLELLTTKKEVQPRSIIQLPGTVIKPAVATEEEDSKAFDPDFNPFEIVEERDPNAAILAWGKKIAQQMAALPLGGPGVLKVSVIYLKNQRNVLAAINAAKLVLSEQAEFKEASWQCKTHKDASTPPQYTHTTVKRIS